MSASAVDVESVRHRRHWFALLSLASGHLVRVIRLATALITVPLAIRYFGTERYGLWATASVYLSYTALVNSSAGYSLMSRVAEARGRQAPDAIRRDVSSMMLCVTPLAIVATGILLTLNQSGALASIFVADTAHSRELQLLITVLLITGGVQFVLGFYTYIQQAYQEDYLGNIGTTVSQLLNLAVLMLVVRLDGTLWGWAIGTGVVGTLILVAISVLTLRRHPETWPSPGDFSAAEFWRMTGPAFTFLLLGMRQTITWSTDVVIISATLGAASATVFAVVSQIVFFLFTSIHSLPLGYWPAYTESHSRGDWNWIQSTFQNVLLLTSSCACMAGVGFYWWGQDFLVLWLKKVAIPADLVTLFSVYLPLVLFIEAHGVFLVGLKANNALVPPALGTALIHLAASLFLIPRVGIVGAVIATLIPDLLVASWLYPRVAATASEGRVRPLMAPLLREVLPPTAVAWAVGAVSYRFLAAVPPLAKIGIGSILTVGAYLATARLTSPSMWKLLGRAFKIARSRGRKDEV